MLSKQEVYEHVRNHLLTQNSRSVDDNDCPLYHAPWGHKCAIGCLIANEHYQHKIQGTAVFLTRTRPKNPFERSADHILADALFKSGVDVDDEEMLDLLIELQDLHDVIPIDRWNSELDAIALNHGLALPL